MLKKVKDSFNQNDVKRLFIKTSKSIHVSFFHKFESREDLKGKKFTIVDFEFSTDYQIFEMAFFDVIDGKVSNYNFKEFQLPVGTTYFDINRNRPVKVTPAFNKGKEKLTPALKKYIIERMENCDYLVAHNYVAELQCYMKLKFPNQKYDANKIPMFKDGKVICTRYSFPKKYFEKFNMSSHSNGHVSSFFKWSVKIEESNSKTMVFKINNPRLNGEYEYFVEKQIFSKTNASYHNAMFDIFITLTNLKTLGFLLK